VDFQKAYDTIWKLGLYEKLVARGIPCHIVNWLRAFLHFRQSRVLWNGVKSRYKIMQEGLPQGSVLAPLLFLLFIDDLVPELGDDVTVSLFADDLAILASGKTLKQCEAKARKAVHMLEDWANRWMMTISKKKTEILLFSLYRGEAKGTIHPCVYYKDNPTHITIPIHHYNNNLYDPYSIVEDKRPILRKDLTYPEPYKSLQQYAGLMLTAVNEVAIRHPSELIHFRSSLTLHLTLHQPVPFNPFPKFLGVTFDGRLTFIKHLQNVKLRMQNKLRLLSQLTGTSWGCRQDTLRMLYRSTIEPVAAYCLGVYGSVLTQTRRLELARVQLLAARMITGCVRSTPCDVVLRESRLLPICLLSDTLAAMALEKLLRFPKHYASYEIAYRQHPNKGSSWRNNAMVVTKACELLTSCREPLTMCSEVPPWYENDKVEFRTELVTVTSRKDAAKVRLKAALQTLEALPPADVVVYSDGSAEEGCTNGGYGVFIEYKSEEATHRGKAGFFTSSFRAEIVGLTKGLAVLNDMLERQELPPGSAIRILTDSQSALKRLSAGYENTTGLFECRIWELIDHITSTYGTTIILQFVPGHCDLPGNERADVLAKEGTETPDQRLFPLDFATAKTVIKRKAREIWKSRTRESTFHYMATEGRTLPKLESWMSRRDEVVLAQLRSGHSPLTQSYLHLIGVSATQYCLCGAVDDIPHLLLICPNTMADRNVCFAEISQTDRTLPVLLLKKRRCVVEFLQCIGRFTSPSTE